MPKAITSSDLGAASGLPMAEVVPVSDTRPAANKGMPNADASVYPRMDEARHDSTQNSPMASSLPMSIPIRKSSKWVGYDLSEGPTAFIPPHKLSCRDADHLAGSVPLSSSALLRTRTKILQSTGMLPSNSTVGFLISRTGASGEERESQDGARSDEEKSPRNE